MRNYIQEIFNKIAKKKKFEAKKTSSFDYREIEFANNCIRYAVCGEFTHFIFPDKCTGLTVSSYLVKGISPHKFFHGFSQGTHHGVITSTDVKDFLMKLNSFSSEDSKNV